jgi:protein-S-isoprenylcysteine O-methyltransferase Ste14
MPSLDSAAGIEGLLILVCWVTYGVYWISAARKAKPNAERQDLKSMLAHRIPFILGIFLIACPNLIDALEVQAIPDKSLARAAASLICIMGLAFAMWARRTLAGNWSGSVNFKQGHQLIESGPYRLVRHPIYTGVLLMLLALALESDSFQAMLGFAFACVALVIKLTQEEALMIRHFPDEYPSYRERVRALVPFVI